MNQVTSIFLVLCAAAFLWNLVSGISIVQTLHKKNLAQSAFVMRYAPWFYLREYRKLTLSQSGKIGPLYYHYTLSIGLLLLSGLILVLMLMV